MTNFSTSVHQSNLSSPDVPLFLNPYCFFEGAGSIIYTFFIFTYLLLILLLCIPILCHGLLTWRQNSSAAPVSHTDCFTYHVSVMEMIAVLGLLVCCLGFYLNSFSMYRFGSSASIFTIYGEEIFHFLTCLERYLAVVHPLTYLRLKTENGIRLRNVSAVCVWLLCFAFTAMFEENDPNGAFFIVDLSFLSVNLSIIFFCSLSVLCVLIGPGPGQAGENRRRVDQSKQKAFFTIVCILAALTLRFASNLTWEVLFLSGESFVCVFGSCFFWVNLPSSLVLPLLFLHKKGKLMFKKKQRTAGLD